MRNFTRTLATVSLLVPAGAHPLGIGDLELHSALNQNLNAEIALNISEGENISDIKVNLASPEQFEKAGIPTDFFLTRLKFKPTIKPDGSVVIQLSSTEVIREPFLDFLIEVSWPSGSLYREFTVLIDPPATYQHESVVVASSSTPAVHSVSQTVSDSALTEMPSADVYSGTGEYGPVVKNDTLWKVAERVNTSDDVSVEQMLIALFEANPQAFYKDNVNALMAGEKLRIPDRDAVLKLSRKQAAAEINQQTAEWRGQINSESGVVASGETEESNSSQLTLIAPEQGEINQHAVVTSKEINSGEEAGTLETVSGDPVESLKEYPEIQARLDKMEQQLATMQKLLSVKDQQLAALQGNSVIAASNQSVASATATEKMVDSSSAASQEQTVKATPPVSEFKTSPVSEKESSLDPYYLVVASVGSTLMLVLGWLWWRERQLQGTDTTESMFAASSEIVLPDTEDELSVPVLNSDSSYGVGTVGESSFLSEFSPDNLDAFETDQSEVDPLAEADVYLAYGRYQQAEELIQQAINDHPDRDQCKMKLLEIYFADENIQSFEEYAQELADSGKNKDPGFWSKVCEMGSEISPASELYVAAPEQDIEPSNDSSDSEVDDLKISSEYDTDSEHIEDDDLELDLTAFNIEEEATNTTESEDEEIRSDDSVLQSPDSDSKENGLDFDLSKLDPEFTEGEDAGLVNESDGIETDTESVEDSENELNSSESIHSGDAESLDFDLTSSLDSSSDEYDPDVNTPSDSEANGLDFDLSTMDTEFIEGAGLVDGSDGIKIEPESIADSEDELNSTESKHSDEAESPGFDLTSSLDSITIPELGTENLESESTESFAKLNPEFIDSAELDKDTPLDSSSNKLDLDVNTPDFDLFADDDVESEVSDLTDLDEIETKIDLAKAYVDMGDEEAARNIVEEVLEKGNANQKEEAQSVLEKLQ